MMTPITYDGYDISGKQHRAIVKYGMSWESGIFPSFSAGLKATVGTDTSKIDLSPGLISFGGLLAEEIEAQKLDVPSLANGTKCVLVARASLEQTGTVDYWVLDQTNGTPTKIQLPRMDIVYDFLTGTDYETPTEENMIYNDSGECEVELCRFEIQSGGAINLTDDEVKKMETNFSLRVRDLETKTSENQTSISAIQETLKSVQMIKLTADSGESKPFTADLDMETLPPGVYYVSTAKPLNWADVFPGLNGNGILVVWNRGGGKVATFTDTGAFKQYTAIRKTENNWEMYQNLTTGNGIATNGTSKMDAEASVGNSVANINWDAASTDGGGGIRLNETGTTNNIGLNKEEGNFMNTEKSNKFYAGEGHFFSGGELNAGKIITTGSINSETSVTAKLGFYNTNDQEDSNLLKSFWNTTKSRSVIGEHTDYTNLGKAMTIDQYDGGGTVRRVGVTFKEKQKPSYYYNSQWYYTAIQGETATQLLNIQKELQTTEEITKDMSALEVLEKLFGKLIENTELENLELNIFHYETDIVLLEREIAKVTKTKIDNPLDAIFVQETQKTIKELKVTVDDLKEKLRNKKENIEVKTSDEIVNKIAKEL